MAKPVKADLQLCSGQLVLASLLWQAEPKSQATHGQHLGVKSIQIAIKQTGAQAHWLTSTLASNQLASFACKFDQAQQAMARADRSQHKEESKDKTHYKERKHVT